MNTCLRSSFVLGLVLTATGCNVEASSNPNSGPVGGKADDFSCAIHGTFVAEGNWPSFSEWSFAFSSNELADSHTDDLGADEWPTEVSFGHGTARVTLTQTTEAADAIVQTVLHLDASRCADGVAQLEVIGAYTVTFDSTSSQADSLERHVVELSSSGPVEGGCRVESAAVDCAYSTVDSNGEECVMDDLAVCVTGVCHYASYDLECSDEDDCWGSPCIEGICYLTLDDIDFEDCPEGSSL